MVSKNGQYTGTEDDLNSLIGLLRTQNTVYIPHANGLRFVRLEDHENLHLPLPQTRISPKEFLLPQTECLFTFEANDRDHGPGNGHDDTKSNIVLLGVKPCDAAAIVLLDRVFLSQQPQDPYYRIRRERTKIIAMTCNHPAISCFCTSVDIGPDSPVGADLCITDLGGRFVIEAITQWGNEVIHDLPQRLHLATQKDLEEKHALTERIREQLDAKIDIQAVVAKSDDFQAPWWDRYHQKCLGCGVCTYLCPTCHCFDITDETINNKGRRIRTWDSCQYSLFTAHASGHNPRPTQKERMRQRIMHKFNYSIKSHNRLFCVGCGRCIQYCPVNLDIRNVLRDIAEAP